MQLGIIAILLIVLVILIRIRTYEPFVMNEIPKVIWTFWDKDELPEIVQKSIENWKKYCPGFEVIIVTMSNVSQFLPEINIEDFRSDEFIQRKSDMVRLGLLAKYGGIWSDASIATKKSYDWIIEEQKKRKFEFMGYYRVASTEDQKFPIVENWFFAAIPNSYFVSKWRDEFQRLSDFKTSQEYIEDLKNKGVNLQGIPDPNYLTPYASAQLVMQNDIKADYVKDKLYLLPADDGPFRHATRNGWDPKKSMEWICQNDTELPDMIKIYGLERRAVESEPALKCMYKIFE
jgi:hypothetical protein